MNWLNFDIKKVVIILALALLPLVSINTQRRPTLNGWYDKPISFIAGLVESFYFVFSDGVRGTTKMYIDLIDLKKESQKVREQNNELLAKLKIFAELESENNRLSKLLDFKRKYKMDLVAARVISRDLLSDHDTIRINKGLSDGIKEGMAVITTEGAVGHIFKPDEFSSHVMLLTDRYSVVDGINFRSRARGIVEGKNQHGLTLQYVNKNEDIQKDDLIITSGLDNIFPKGFPIAKVESVENKMHFYSVKVELRPAVESDKVEEVFVITNSNHQDLSPAEEVPKEASEKKSITVKEGDAKQ